MATKLKPVDVVPVGVGLTGTILAKELADSGLKIVGLERGGWRDTQSDFAMPYAHDELRYARRHELMRSEEHTSELQSLTNLVCRLLLEKKKKRTNKQSARKTTARNTTSTMRTNTAHT